MVVSWLSPVNNKGAFVLSMNVKRCTSLLLKNSPHFVFVLSVPVQGMEDLVLSIGRCSGFEVDKFSTFNIPVCTPGWLPVSGAVQSILEAQKSSAYPTNPNITLETPQDSSSKQKSATGNPQLLAVSPCVAHLVCHVIREESSETDSIGVVFDGHYILRCQIEEAFVKKEYWSNNNFITQDSKTNPPYLTFLGSQQFGCVVSTKETPIYE